MTRYYSRNEIDPKLNKLTKEEMVEFFYMYNHELIDKERFNSTYERHEIIKERKLFERLSKESDECLQKSIEITKTIYKHIANKKEDVGEIKRLTELKNQYFNKYLDIEKEVEIVAKKIQSRVPQSKKVKVTYVGRE